MQMQPPGRPQAAPWPAGFSPEPPRPPVSLETLHRQLQEQNRLLTLIYSRLFGAYPPDSEPSGY